MKDTNGNKIEIFSVNNIKLKAGQTVAFPTNTHSSSLMLGVILNQPVNMYCNGSNGHVAIRNILTQRIVTRRLDQIVVL